MITFNLLTLPNLSHSLAINAVAIDQNTARTALSSSTDNHYLLRYGSLFASSFLQGYGQAIQSSGTTVSTTGLTTQTATPSLSPRQEIAVALGNVGTQWGNQLNTIFNTPPTVHVYSGTGLGILFLADVPSPV
jgi:intracellular multiplication protein IcmE